MSLLPSHFLPFLSVAVLLCACNVDDNDDNISSPAYEIPSTYNFENVSYTGQQERLSMLKEMRNYLSSGAAGVELDSNRLQAMFVNKPEAGFANAYAKDLRSKTYAPVQADFDTYFNRVAKISAQPTTASPGMPGIITSPDGTKKYLVDAGGIEWAQIIQKGLMGATFYYQATSVYLGEQKMMADNLTVVPGEGTAMQHHWDEAFGYWGVPRDFPSNKDGILFWGSYSNQRDEAIGSNQKLMHAFTKGRAAINNMDLATRDDAIAEARNAWEQIAAASVIHYLNAAQAAGDNMAARLHVLSEGIGFAYSLQFNETSRFNRDDYRVWITQLAGSPEFEAMNFYTIDDAKINAARISIAEKYGLNNQMMSL